MQTPSDSLNYLSLQSEVVRLKAAAEELQSAIKLLQRPTVPAAAAERADRLSTGLKQMLGKVDLLEEERQNLDELARMGQVINSSLDLNSVLQSVMDTIIRITGAERVFLMLRTSSGDMEIQMGRNWEQETLEPSENEVSRTVVQRMIRNGSPIFTTNALEDPRFSKQDSVQAKNLRSILCVPMKIKDELVGVIYADHRVRSGLFSRKDIDLLVSFASQAAVALENARLFESLQRTLFEVTGLKNLLNNVLSSITSAVLSVNLQGVITVCNPAAEELLGKAGQSIRGKSLLSIAPEMTSLLGRSIANVMVTGQSAAVQEFQQDISGKGTINFSARLSPLKNEQGGTEGVTIVLDDLTEKKHLEAQQRLFERMVSPAVIEQLDPNSLRLGGSRSEITVMFADLRDFTGFSESVSPEELVRILNCYLAAAADAVLKEEGTVDKFLGDAVMAWFNAPVPQPDHVLRAVRAAIGIRAAIQKLHVLIDPKYHLSFGIGINVGEAVLGLVGSEKRLEFTAIGDCVNIARRLQESAGHGQILISQEVYERIQGQVRAHPIDPITVKGKREVIQVYAVDDLL